MVQFPGLNGSKGYPKTLKNYVELFWSLLVKKNVTSIVAFQFMKRRLKHKVENGQLKQILCTNYPARKRKLQK